MEKSHLKGLYVVFFLLIVLSLGYSLSMGTYKFAGAKGYVASTDSLGVKDQIVRISCDGPLNDFSNTTTTNGTGYYNFVNSATRFSCTTNCTAYCDIYQTSYPDDKHTFSITITNSGSLTAGTVHDFTYPENLDITGTFTPATGTYGKSFNGFTFNNNSIAGNTVQACRYSNTLSDFNIMTSTMTNINEAYNTNSFTLPASSGTYTYYVACQSNLITEDESHVESIDYTFDFDKSKITLLDNATNSILPSIPATVDITINELSKCQVTSADTGYSYSAANCTSTYETSTTCNLPSMSEGSNNFYISCIDQYGNYNTSSDNLNAQYSIDLTSPAITPILSGSPVYYEKGAVINNFDWNIFDAGVSVLTPGSYEIFIDDILDSSDAWTNPNHGVSSIVDTNTLASHNYTLIATDYVGHKGSSYTNIIVQDTTAPAFSVTLPEEMQVYGSTTSLNVTVVDDDVYECWANDTGANITLTQLVNPSDYGRLTTLSNGTYYVEFYCNDTSDNEAFRARTFMIDALPPAITSPANANMSISDSLTLSFAVSDMMRTGHYYFLLNGTLYSPVSVWNQETNVTANVDTLRGHGLWNYTIFANDTFNNIIYSTVLVNITDDVAPIISIISPLSTPVYTSVPSFNVTLNEEGNNCLVSIDGGATTAMTKLSTTNFGLIMSVPDGTHTVDFFCNDMHDNTANDNTVLKLDTQAPYIIAHNISSSFAMNSTGNIISWTLGDDYSAGYYNLSINGILQTGATAWTNNTQFNIPIDTNAGLGAYTYTLDFNDTYYHDNSDSVTVNIIDNIAPVLTITNPENKAYSINILNLNVSLNENGNGCAYSLNGNANTSMQMINLQSFGSEITAINGVNIAVISCNDTYDNTGYSSLQFAVDTNSPYLVNFTGNTIIPMNDTQSIAWVLGDDAFPGNYTILLNSVQATTWTAWINNTSIPLQVNTNIGVGDLNYTILFNDSVGNMASDERIIRVIDNVAPEIYILHTDEFLTTNLVEFNATLNEPGNTCRYRVNGSSYFDMDQLSQNSFGAYNNIYIDGYFIIDYNCTDIYDNWGYNSTSVTVDQNPPSVISSPTQSVFEIRSLGLINWTLYDTIASSGYYNVTINGTEYLGATRWDNNILFDVIVDTNMSIGDWEYTLHFNDTTGHSDSDSFTVTLQDTTPPDVTHTFIQNYYSGGNWLYSNETTLVCVAELDDLWDVDHYEFSYALDDNVWTNVTCTNPASEYCNWTIPRETMPLNISCRAVDASGNTGNYAQNQYAGLDMSAPTISIEPVALITSNPYTLSIYAYDSYSGVANVTYWYNNITGGYLIGINNSSPFNYTWTVPAALENTFINISASCYDYGTWLSNTAVLEDVGINAVDEAPVVNFYMLNYSDGNSTIELDATSSYDPDYLIDGVNTRFNYQVSNDSITFENITGCADTTNSCLWDTTSTLITCPEYNTCYVSVQAYDNTNVVRDTKTYYIDNTNPLINSLSPNNNIVMYGLNQSITCSASDAGDALLNMSLEIYMDRGFGNEWFTLNDSTESNNLYHNLFFEQAWPNQYNNIIIRCNATDNNGNINSSISSGISLDRVGPYFWNDAMNVSNNIVLGRDSVVKYSIYSRDLNPGVNTLLFNTTSGLIGGANPSLYYYELEQQCVSTSANQYFGVFANDSLGHSNNTVFASPYTWYCDVDAPAINGCSFDTTNPVIYNNEVVRLNCSVTDLGYSTVDTVIFNSTSLEIPSNSGDYYYQDITCSIANNGAVSWSGVFANDSLNNMRFQGLSEIVECDALPPAISYPVSNATGGYQNDYICIEANITDTNPSSAWMELGLPDSSTINVTLEYDAGSSCGGKDYGATHTYGYNLLLEQQGQYVVSNVFANDTGSQMNSIPTWIEINVYDNLSPAITDVVVIGNTSLKAWENSTLRATVVDQGVNGVDTVLFEFSGINETGIRTIGNYYTYTFRCSDAAAEGRYNLTHVFANDTGANTAVYPSAISLVCDAKAPRIDSFGVNTTAVEQYDWVCISANVTDAYTDKVWVSMTQNSVNTNLSLSSTNPCSQGNYGAVYQLSQPYDLTINEVYANDTAGNTNISVYNQVITVDESIYPQLRNCQINDTMLGDNEIGRLSCEIRDNEGVSSARFELEDYVPPGPSTYTNNTMLNSSMINYYYDFSCNFMTGPYNKTILGVYANDTDTLTHNSAYFMNEKIYCDLNPPVINSFWVETNQTTQYSSVCVNASVTEIDTGVLSAALEVNTPYSGLISYTMSGNASCASGPNSYGVDLNLSQPGIYTFSRIIVQDYVHNYDIEEINYLVESIDNTTPVVAINSPLNASYNNPNITVSYTVNEAYISQYWYVLDNNAPVFINGSAYLINISNGAHNVTVYARDTYNNIGSSSVQFTTNTASGAVDLRIMSLNTPADAIDGYVYNISSVVANEGSIDAVNALIKFFNNNVLMHSENRDLFHNASVIVSFNSTLNYGSHNITVVAEPFSGESDTLDNSMTKFANVDYLINKFTISGSTPDAVSPSTTFVSRVYEYQNIVSSAAVTNLFTPDTAFTINGANTNTTILNNNTLVIVTYSLTSPAALGNYSVSSSSWINGMPGNKSLSENVEVRQPESPIFSIDVVVIPDTFVSGLNNLVFSDIYNYGNETAHNVNATIHLPSGLNLASGSATQLLGDITPGNFVTATWTVAPEYSGSFSIDVTAACDEDYASASSSGTPVLSLDSVEYNNLVEINKNITVNALIDNSGVIADNTVVSIILGANMTGHPVTRTVSVPTGADNYLVQFNFTAGREGAGQSFKIIVQHSASSYYEEFSGQFSVWKDSIPPSGTPVLEGWSTIEGYNIISWTPVSDTATYYIFKGINGQTDFNPLTPNATVPYTTTSWTDRNVDVNKWYYYRVAAVDSAGNVGNLSLVKRVIPESVSVITSEIEQLRTELNEYTNIEFLEQQHLAFQAQVSSDIDAMLREMNYLNNVSVLLTPQQYMKVNSIKSTLLTAKSRTMVNEKNDFLMQAKYQLAQMAKTYDAGEQDLVYENSVGNLSVKTNEHLLTVRLDSTNYYKFTVTKTIINQKNYEIQDITITFGLPSDAILAEDLTVSDGRIVETIDSLIPGENMTVSYSFYSMNSFQSTDNTGFMTEILPASPPRPITGFVVFERGEDEGAGANMVVVVWTLAIITALAYFQKDKIFKIIRESSKKEETFEKKEVKKDEPRMIEIKIKRE